MDAHEPGDFVVAVKPVLYAIANAILSFFRCCVSFTKFIGFLYSLWLFVLLLFSHLMIFELRKGYFMEYCCKKCNFLWLLKFSSSADSNECTDIFRHHVNMVSESLAEGWISANLVRDYAERVGFWSNHSTHTHIQRHTWVSQLCDGFRLNHNESGRLSSCIPTHCHKCHGVFN